MKKIKSFKEYFINESGPDFKEGVTCPFCHNSMFNENQSEYTAKYGWVHKKCMSDYKNRYGVK